jgi:hypothetical protein
MYDETVPTGIKPKQLKKGGTQGKIWEDWSSQKTNEPAKRGDQVLGSFVCCLPRLCVFHFFLSAIF